MQLPFDQSADLQAIVRKVFACHRQETFLCRRPAIDPEVWRDVRVCVMLCGHFMTEKQRAHRIGDRLGGSLDKARAATRTHGCHGMDNNYARQPEQPDHKSQRQLRVVRLSQNDQRQLAPEAMQSHDRDVSDEEYDEGAKSQEMQTPCTLPSVEDFDIPRKTSGDGWGHRYSRRNAQRCKQEYHCCIAQLL